MISRRYQRQQQQQRQRGLSERHAVVNDAIGFI